MDFADVVPDFWARPIHVPEVFPALRTSDVAEAESVLGVRLPSEYIELLRLQNGGTVSEQFDAFPTTESTSWADDHIWFRSLAGIGTSHTWPSITARAGSGDDWGLPSDLVAFDGDGHYFIALDYRLRDAETPPAVTWFDTEMGHDIVLAPTFRAFVEALVPMSTFPEPELEPTIHLIEPGTERTECTHLLTVDVVAVAAPEDAEDPGRLCPDCVRLRRPPEKRVRVTDETPAAPPPNRTGLRRLFRFGRR